MVGFLSIVFDYYKVMRVKDAERQRSTCKPRCFLRGVVLDTYDIIKEKESKGYGGSVRKRLYSFGTNAKRNPIAPEKNHL